MRFLQFTYGLAYWLTDVPLDSVEAAREKLAQMAYCRQPNILFEGSNLQKTPNDTIETMNECQALCDDTPTCHAVTFNDEGCRMKNSEWNAREWISSEGATSWNKDCGECVKVDTNYVGGDLDVKIDLKTVETPVDCWEICYATPRCAAFTWRKGTGCSVKDDTAEAVSIEDNEVILSWSRDCMENPLNDENADKVMGHAIKEAEAKSERYADAIEAVMEDAERAIKTLDGEQAVTEVETRLHRMAVTAEELKDVLDAQYGDDELQEDERETKFDAQGIRMTRLDQERAKVRAQADAGKIGGGAVPASSRLNDLLAPDFDETAYKKDEPMFEDETVEELQVERCIERGVTYEEGDLPDGYIADAVTFYQCYQACDVRDECAYFVFSEDDGCELKSKEALASRRYTEDFNIQSGARSCFNCSQIGIRYLGGNLNKKPAASVSSVTECQRLCEKSSQCATFSFTDDVGCTLKSEEALKNRVYTGSFTDVSWTKKCGSAVFFCGVDEHVKNGKCVQCPAGLHNERGDNPAFGDTECDQCTAKGVRFIGSNLRSQPKNIKTAAGCRLACAKRSDCHHISFRAKTKQCYLKGSTGDKKYKTSYDVNDIAWSKECGRHDDMLTLEEFKLTVLREAPKMIKDSKQTALVKQAEIIEKKLPGKKLEEMVASDNDDDVIQVVDTLLEVQDQRRRLSRHVNPRKLQRQRVYRRPQRTYTRTVRRRYTKPTSRQRYTRRQPTRHRRSTRRRTVRRGGGPLIKNKKTEDTVVGYLNNVESADFVGVAGTAGLFGNSAVGDISNALNIIQPLIAAGVTSNKEVRARQLLESKLAVLKALPLPGPVQMLFSFAHQMVDKTNGHFGNRSINMPELMKYLGPITVTSVLEVIGNGHLKDLRNVIRIGSKVMKARTLKVINVTDVLTLAMATTRTASIFLPMFYVPLQLATGVIKLVRDMGLLDNPRNNAILQNVLGFIEQGPKLIIKAIAGIGKVIGNMVGGFVRFIFGGGRRRNHGRYRGQGGGVQNSIRGGSNVIGGIIGGAAKAVGGIVNGFRNLFRGRRRTRNNWRRRRY